VENLWKSLGYNFGEARPRLWIMRVLCASSLRDAFQMKPCTIRVDPTERARSMCGHELIVLARQTRRIREKPVRPRTNCTTQQARRSAERKKAARPCSLTAR